MMTNRPYKIAVLPGDGIGPEVTTQAVRLLETVAQATDMQVEFKEVLLGGAALDAVGDPLPSESLQACLDSDAVLLGAVGGPDWDEVELELRPEQGLLRLRQELDLFANLRPIRLRSDWSTGSPLRPAVIGGGIDILVVRELTAGIYYGEHGQETTDNGQRVYDTMVYTEEEIERIVRLAFATARRRRRRIVEIDKSNVLATSRLWRNITEDIAKEYPDVAVDYLYVDSGAMELVKEPGRFDVIVTENMFGDILSDLGAGLVGSIGLMPSASLSSPGRPALYEAVHGSAPSIAGLDISNPIGMILSVAMMMRHSFGREREAQAIEGAVDEVLREGPWTPDVAPAGAAPASTEMVGSAIRRRAAQRLGAGNSKVGSRSEATDNNRKEGAHGYRADTGSSDEVTAGG